jgi:xanthine dehydrogenase YagS FAD-binding subunit
MTPFAYSRATDLPQALAQLSAKPAGKLLGGGTNLIDLMKMGVETPAQLIDLNRLPLATVEELPGGKGVRVGGLARNSDVAEHPFIKARYPVLSQALLAGASPQLRNRATTGGNLLQRTRCPYFYDPDFPACNKRVPGSGCGAVEGFNRMHAILGQSASCIATHPSDMCVAMAALEAIVRVSGPKGEREIAFADFHRLPGDSPDKETTLAADEIITAVDLPAHPFAAKSHYLKVRDRASYAFALVSVAAALEMDGDKIKTARIALGGVAHKPWRAVEAEEMLAGKTPTEAVFRAAADAALAEAKGYQHNTFKIELARRTIVRALTTLTAKA